MSARIINDNMAEEYISGTDANLLMEQVRLKQQTIGQSLQLMINREVDKIQRLVTDSQAKINYELNGAFQGLSERANAIVGKRIQLQFQVFRIGDLDQRVGSGFEVSEDYMSTEQDNEENN